VAFWWVNQGKSFVRESTFGYLWAPNESRHHWDRLAHVLPSDIVFSYSEAALRATAVATTGVRNGPRPEARSADWKEDLPGRLILATYVPIRPIPLADLEDELKKKLNVRYGPLDCRLKGKQGYMFELTDETGSELMTFTARNSPETS
jgi:hypothetical protein